MPRPAAGSTRDAPHAAARRFSARPGHTGSAHPGRRPLLYVLHSGYLFGTERMGLATAAGLADDFDPVILAPPGPALERAAPMGLGAEPFASTGQLVKAVRAVPPRGTVRSPSSPPASSTRPC